MSQTLNCPRCSKAVSVAQEDLGHRVACPHCESEFLTPGPGGLNPSQSPDDDDWLNLDPSPPKKQQVASPATSEDDLLEQYAFGGEETDSAVSESRSPSDPFLDDPSSGGGDDPFDDEFIASTEQVPKPGKQKPKTKAASKGNQASPIDDDPFGDEGLDLPDFLDTMPSDKKTSNKETSASPARSAASPQRKDEPEYAEEFRIKCRICHSPTYVKATQEGQTIKCADCHSPMKVPAPPKTRKTKLPDLSRAAPMTFQETRASERRGDPFEKSAAELLAKAEASEEDEPETNYDNPDVKEWVISVFGIFKDPGVIAHWLAFSALAGIPVYLAARFPHPMLTLALFPFAILVGALVSACGFAVLESVANRQDHVTAWPVFDPGEWFGQLFVVMAAAAVAIVPVCAVIGPIFGASLLLLLMAMLSVFLIFPFVLLSMMDMGSPFAPFSSEVARSVTKCQEAWGGMYFSSGILFAALFLFIAMGWSTGAPSANLFSITAAIGVTFIYFAMIGRLAYAIGQSVDSHVEEEPLPS